MRQQQFMLFSFFLFLLAEGTVAIYVLRNGYYVRSPSNYGLSESDSQEHGNNSSSIASSSSSSQEDDDDLGEIPKVLVRTADKVLSYALTKTCPQNKFLSKDGNCQLCALCGPGMYVREKCSQKADTICGWCYGANSVKNANFLLKCSQKASLSSSSSSSSSSSQAQDNDENETDEDEKSTDTERLAKKESGKNSMKVESKSFLFSAITIDGNVWWKIEFVMEMIFYIALIALIFAVIRFLSKALAYKKHRTIHIDTPVFGDDDRKNIMKAAASLREKLGKNGYERLENFV